MAVIADARCQLGHFLGCRGLGQLALDVEAISVFVRHIFVAFDFGLAHALPSLRQMAHDLLGGPSRVEHFQNLALLASSTTGD